MVLDLGGVVFQLDWRGAAERLGLSGASAPGSLSSSLSQSRIYDQFERGHVTSDAFRTEFSRRISQPLSEAEFDLHWNSLVAGFFPGVPECLKRLRDTGPLMALSNTNPIHWSYLESQFQLSSHFHQCLASCELGFRKPETEIFAEAVKRLGCTAKEVLFVDDTEANVDAGKHFGFQAYHLDVSQKQLPQLIAEIFKRD